MTFANQLTLLRIFLIPVFVIVFYTPFQWHYFVTGLIFSIAAITDWLDGYVARKYDQATPFGAFLDPVADKLMVAVALVLLIEVYATPWFTIPAVVIVCREIVVSALREWMAELGARTSVAVSYIGKVKTTIQMTAIIYLLAFKAVDHIFFNALGYTLIYAAALLTLWSMILYLKAAWPLLMPKDE